MFKLLQSVFPRRAVSEYAKPLYNPHGPVMTVEQFDEAKARLQDAARRMDKILVYCTDSRGTTNEVLVTPNDSPLSCLKQISPSRDKTCALAIATYPSGHKEYVSLTSSLNKSCDLELLDIDSRKAEHRREIEKAFWRSCGILGAAASSIVFPSTPIYPLLNVNDGFYTVVFEDKDFEFPFRKEYKFLETMGKLKNSDHVFDNLYVPKEIAREYGFETSLNLCKLADRVFAVDGPTIAFPRQIGSMQPFPTCHRTFYTKGSSILGYVRFGGFAVPAGTKVGGLAKWSIMVDAAMEKFAKYGETPDL